MSALGQKRTSVVNGGVLVFDRNYVAFQALLSSCFRLFGWFANNYRAPGKILLLMLTANRLRKILSYAPATGIFRWKVSASTRAPVGTIAGAKNGGGYRQIRIDGRPYSASRLAWLYKTQTDLAISKQIVVTACMLAPPNRGSLNRPHVDGTCVPVKEPSTASKADICSAAKFRLFDHLI